MGPNKVTTAFGLVRCKHYASYGYANAVLDTKCLRTVFPRPTPSLYTIVCFALIWGAFSSSGTWAVGAIFRFVRSLLTEALSSFVSQLIFLSCAAICITAGGSFTFVASAELEKDRDHGETFSIVGR